MSLEKSLIALLVLIAVIIPSGCDARTSSAVSKTRAAGAPAASAAMCKKAKTISAAYSRQLSWDVPEKRTDGTALNNIAGYRVYFGTTSGLYTGCVDVQSVDAAQDKQEDKSSLVCRETAADDKRGGGKKQCTYTVPMQSNGTYYFTVTAYDDAGNESDFSNEVRNLIK